jgi:hypothetical protein
MRPCIDVRLRGRPGMRGLRETSPVWRCVLRSHLRDRVLIPVSSWISDLISESGMPWRDIERAIALSSSEIGRPTTGIRRGHGKKWDKCWASGITAP